MLGFAVIVFLAGIGSDDFERGTVVDIPDRLVAAGVLLAISLMLDLPHYIVGSVIWYVWPRFHEYRRSNPAYEAPDHFPGWLPAVVNALLAVKLACAVAGWAMLLVYIAYPVQ